MMDFMDVFVEGTPVETSMGPVMECIFHYKENGDLPGHGGDGREGNIDDETKVMDYGMEEVYLRQLNREMLQQDILCTRPLFG